nr:SH3 domain-binding protein 4-B-like isoform X2 [Ciona intestinalis]|eukprot:XP_026690470.1 SH3 domain-binding protein 4-B-like isoform X2 [Ciona intestinalis]
MKLYEKCTLVANWYHGCLEKEASEYLCKDAAIGGFLVWTLNNTDDTYMLTVKENDGTVAHYVIGSNCAANDVTDLDWLSCVVNFYQSNCLDGSSCFTVLATSIQQKLENRNVVVAKESFTAYDFACLSFTKGDRLHLLDQESGEWWYAHDGQNIGFIPARLVFELSNRCRQYSNEETHSFPSPTCKSFGEMTQPIYPGVESEDCAIAAKELVEYKVKQTHCEEMRLSWRERKPIPPNLLLFKSGDALSTSTSTSGFDDNFIPSSAPSLFDGSDVSAISVKSDASISSSSYSEENDVIYPASCTHRPRPSILSNRGRLSRSFSEQNVNDMRSRNATLSSQRSTGSRGSLKKALNSTTRIFKHIKRGSTSKPTTPTTPSKDGFDLISINGQSFISLATTGSPDRTKPINESFYKSFEDLTCDEPPIKVIPKSPVRQQVVEKCVKSANSYEGPVFSEVGSAGGVVLVPGTDISLHISATKPAQTDCKFCFDKRKSESMRSPKNPMKDKSVMRRRFSKSTSVATPPTPRLRDSKCPESNRTDGRIAITLEDAPHMTVLNPKREDQHAIHVPIRYEVAGPAVRINLADKESHKNGVVLQMGVSTALPQSDMYELSETPTSKVGFTCLQGEMRNGPFHEAESCYYYGNTLQATLDTSALKNTPTGCQIYAVPVVKVEQGITAAPFSWDRLGQTYHIGIYGPKQTYMKSTCCVSVSCSGFCPPTLRVWHETDFTLRLWASYTMQIRKAQGFRLRFKLSNSSLLKVDTNQDDDIISLKELRTNSRVNKVFVLLQSVKNETLRPRNNSKTDRVLAITLTGEEDGTVRRIKMKVPTEKKFASPRITSPIITRQISRSETLPELRVASSNVEQTHQWAMALQEADILFNRSAHIPGSDRTVCGVKLAVALRSRYRKRHPTVPSHILQYSIGDYMPVLSSQAIWSHGSVHYKDWWVAYSCHKVGLLQKSNATMLEFDDYCHWPEVRVTCGNIIEAIIEPIPHLTATYSVLVDKLARHVTDWLSLATLLRFGERYALNEIQNKRVSPVRHSNALFYLGKFRKYCDKCPKKRSFNQELVRALLYMEHYDLAVELVTRFCVLSCAVEMSPRWQELAALLVGDLQDEDVVLFSESREISSHEANGITIKQQATWKPALSFLSRWHDRFGDDHRAALLTLFQATETLKDSPNRNWPYLTSCVILVLAVDSLRNYDTRL